MSTQNDTPKDELLDKHFENDKWGLVNILKSADRRIGRRRLEIMRRKTHNIAASKVLGLWMEISDGIRQH
ncbi:hypothetical protein FACS1894116_10880 [Betaproteobacteria bacterium]|nr:hypothetical protein FACS1894116_10880 [Betaproteobacteria bacterium]GHT99777.1 hypothetical protein FACS1894154_07550 [Betaproteobacteria bacterium]GHU25544.1 hypothetical protein FACS189488_12840 [Betaproteobacteria bacterium]GHU30570.1 hypothetical protein FACS189497_10470 [Betaproteobacteria bacterium]